MLVTMSVPQLITSVILSAFIVLFSANVLGDTSTNNRPIIGILSQEMSYHLRQHYSSNYKSYIAASYVKFVEGAGARVVPIWIGKEKQYYEDILSKINGVLFPGGSTFFDSNDGYAAAANRIYTIAKRMNKNGEHFPIFGICLGFEVLTYVAARGVEHRIACNSTSQPLPLQFTPNYRKSRMFNGTPNDIIEILKTKNVTANFHHFCVTKKIATVVEKNCVPQCLAIIPLLSPSTVNYYSNVVCNTKMALRKVDLSDKFRILSLNKDINGVEFISSLEHVTYPFYGLQFHPEKNLYEWVLGKKIPHGENAAKVAEYFANFLVSEARKNRHHFESTNEEAASLIYNYPVTYTGLKNSAFVQCYLFKDTDNNGVR